jgi:sugar O-acyltransferase (sialic acid O-acetyltransferase NeuD family)
MINPVIIFGAGALGKLAFDVFVSNGIIVYGFLDDDTKVHQKEVGDVLVLGATEDDGFLKLLGKKCDAFVATQTNKERTYLTEMLKERRHLVPVNGIHKDASFSPHATIGHGNLLCAGSRISSFVTIGNGCVLHPNVVLETEATLGDQVNLGAGCTIGAGVQIGNGAFLGAGVTVIEGIKIGKNASVGAGSVVLADVPAGAKVFGYPAKSV